MPTTMLIQLRQIFKALIPAFHGIAQDGECYEALRSHDHGQGWVEHYSVCSFTLDEGDNLVSISLRHVECSDCHAPSLLTTFEHLIVSLGGRVEKSTEGLVEVWYWNKDLQGSYQIGSFVFDETQNVMRLGPSPKRRTRR